MQSDYEISLDPIRLQLDEIHAFLRTSYWSPNIRRDVVAAAISFSTPIGVYEAVTGRQVGFARVISDGATFAYLCDVYVLPEHAGRGLARRMVRSLLELPKFLTVRRWVLATRDAHGVYRPLGFEDAPAGRWMERKGSPEAWQALDSLQGRDERQPPGNNGN